MLHSLESQTLAFLLFFSSLSFVLSKPNPNAKDFWPPAFNNYNDTANMTPDSGFPYIIPWDNKQSCNIYGALCQPGSIAVSSVGENLRTSLVTMPCSSYLSSQSSFLQNTPCHSFESMLSQTQSIAPWTFSECQGSEATGTIDSNIPNAIPTQVPASLVFPKQETCCGRCAFIIPEIQLFYFPDPNAEAWCSSHNRTMLRPKTAANQTTMNGLRRRGAHGDPAPTITQQNPATTVVISGQTLTSPTMYLKLLREMSMYDDCGVIGTPLTDPFVAITPGGLKTEEPVPVIRDQVMVGPWAGLQLSEAVKKFWTSGMIHDYPGPFTSKTLNVAELECPTVGVGSTVISSQIYTTLGPPWLPYIIPPLEISTLQPIWSSQCTGRFPIGMIGVFDPPHVLNGDPSGLVPPAMAQGAASPTPDVPHPVDKPKAQSGAKLVAPGPTPTLGVKATAKSPAAGDPTEPSNSKNDPADNKSPGENKQHEDPHGSTHSDGNHGTNNGASGSAASDKHDPKDEPAGHSQVIPPAHADTSSSTSLGEDDPKNTVGQGRAEPPTNAEGFNSAPPGKANAPVQSQVKPPAGADAPSPAFPAEEDTKANPAGQSQVKPPAGADAPSPAFPGEENTKAKLTGQSQVNPPMNTDAPSPTFPVEDHSKADPAGRFPGKSSANVVKSPVTAVDDAGGETAKGQRQPNHEPLVPVTIGDQVVTPAASGFSVGRATISPGGPAATIAHTRLSLDSSGVLHVGSQTISLGPSDKGAFTNPPASLITVGSQTFTAGASGFSVGGTIMRPGGPAVTIAHTPVSLGSSGILLVGSRTISLATSTSKTPIPLVFTVGQQTITPQPSGFVVADQTILPGGTAMNYLGTKISLGSSGQLVIGTTTISLPADASHQGNATQNTLLDGSKNTVEAGNPTMSVETFTGVSIKYSVSLMTVACAILFSVFLWQE